MKSDETMTDAGDDLLAGIDLHTWRVPPPSPVDRSSLLVRALSPATSRAKRPRLAWLLAAMVLLNVALATIVVIVLARPATERTVIVQAPAGGSVEHEVSDLLKRLEQEQRELEKKLAEIRELRALVVELSEKVRQYEQQDRREKTTPKRERQAPVDRAPVDSLPEDPYALEVPRTDSSCDEVSCVLNNYGGACCAKFRRPDRPKAPTGLPEGLDRVSISEGVASVRARVAACGSQGAKGKVKVRVRVAPSGTVTNVDVDVTPDAVLGGCVAAAIQKAVFPRSQLGGSFSYPFVF